MCRIGGRLRSCDASRGGVVLEIPPLVVFGSNLSKTEGQCLVGSLTGAVASEKVTEAPKGSLRTDGNRP